MRSKSAGNPTGMFHRVRNEAGAVDAFVAGLDRGRDFVVMEA